MKGRILFIVFSFCALLLHGQSKNLIQISEVEYRDKVAGGWAGKMIGVMYGLDNEFKYDNELYEGSIAWNSKLVAGALSNDDLYVQMRFMMVFDSLGINCKPDHLAASLADASFELCHANRMARRNYWKGIMPPLSGQPKYNMHADDLDFQIESDFIGFMHPGMPQSSNLLADKVGHIMCYGDGVYGGMFVSAMLTQAFIENDIERIVTNSLKMIPASSQYAKCVREILEGYKQYPEDWRKVWRSFTANWGMTDICVPNHAFNIDAKMNGAYVVLALLYGKGDLEKTMEIAVRCGQDTDCNASSAIGVLGVIKGYSKIEKRFTSEIPAIADQSFIYTNYSFNKSIERSLFYTKQAIIKNGGAIKDSILYIRQQPLICNVPLEQSFAGIKYKYQTNVTGADWTFRGEWKDFIIGRGDNDIFKLSASKGSISILSFTGKAILLQGYCNNNGGKADVYLDNRFVKTIDFYYREEAGIYLGNRAHLFNFSGLKNGKHTLKLVVRDDRNPKSTGNNVWVERAIIYQ